MYKRIFENMSKDIVITIPKNIKWDDYTKELDKAKKGEILNFKVSNYPKTAKGCKCYICHDGYIKGYMIICGLEEKEFTCTTTGKIWKGKFIQRTGDFFPIKPVEYKGFQGFRYYNGVA
jgi:hypothetical protein